MFTDILTNNEKKKDKNIIEHSFEPLHSSIGPKYCRKCLLTYNVLSKPEPTFKRACL